MERLRTPQVVHGMAGNSSRFVGLTAARSDCDGRRFAKRTIYPREKKFIIKGRGARAAREGN